VSTVVSVPITKDGQASSTFALSRAWTAAEERCECSSTLNPPV
jgi:hypothetical protein